MSLVHEVYKSCKQLFSSAAYAVGSVPTYTTGLMGYIICLKDQVRNTLF